MNVRLVNGHKTPRVNNSDGCTVLACGCAFTDREFIQMCGDHFDAWFDRHNVAAADHRDVDAMIRAGLRAP